MKQANQKLEYRTVKTSIKIEHNIEIEKKNAQASLFFFDLTLIG